jgi:hypothetical protein
LDDPLGLLEDSTDCLFLIVCATHAFTVSAAEQQDKGDD